MNFKIMAFDVGDVWTGVALSDPMRLFSKPFKTIKTTELSSFITKILQEQTISIIVLGNPITLRGTLSQQTKKVHLLKDVLEKQFPHIQWVLWDERLTSKQADALKKGISQEDKLHAHAVAAAFILESYLAYYQQQHTV